VPAAGAAGRGVPAPATARRIWPALVWALGLALAVGAGVAVFAPWLNPRFDYLVDDGWNHAMRAGAFDAVFRRGELYPRWWPDLAMGYGYPMLYYYSPGIYYLAEVFQLAGVSTYRSLHLVALTAAVLGAAGAYVLGAVSFRQPLAGLVLAVAYVAAPYPFVTNLYNRGAFPEAMGLALLPWVLTAGTVAVLRRRPLAVLALGALLAGLVLVHSLTALAGAGVLVLWIGATLADAPAGTRRDGALRAGAGIALGAALSAGFWLPVLLEQGAVHTELASGGTLSFRPWLFDPLSPGPIEPVIDTPAPFRLSGGPIDLNWVYPHANAQVPGPVKPGLAQVLFLAVAVGAWLPVWLGRRTGRPEAAGSATAGGALPAPFPVARAWLCLVLGLACWLLNTTWSDVIWETAPLLHVLQFPWRLYGPFSLALAFTGTAVFAWLSRHGRQQWLLALFLVTFVAVNGRAGHPLDGRLSFDAGGWGSFASRLRGQEGEFVWSGTLSGGEFLPRSVLLPEEKPPRWSWKGAFEARYPSGGWIAGRVWPLDPAVEVHQVWDRPTWTAARVAVAGDAAARVGFRTFVFPGWRAYVDGRPVALAPAPFDDGVGLGHGFAVVTVPPGEHDVQIALGSTAPRTAGALLAVAGLGGAAVFGLGAVGRPNPARRRRARRAVYAGVALAALAVLGRDLWPAWRAPGRPGPSTAGIVLDVNAAVREGRGARIGSPDGGKLGSFVDVRDETIGGRRRTWLYMHPPSEVQVQVDVPPDAVFQAGLGVDPVGWEEKDADGVRFLLEVIDASGGRQTLLDEVVQPQVRPQDRGWRFAEVGLGAYAGQRVTLSLRTEGRDTPLFDWAGWASPAVYVDRGGRFPPAPGVAAAQDFVPWPAPAP
jgi:hypothetical protein